MANFDQLDVPSEIPVLPLDGLVIFPYEIAPLAIRDPREIALAEEAAAGKKVLGLFLREEGTLYPFGVAATILQLIKLPDGAMRLLIRGQTRLRLLTPTQETPYLKYRVLVLADEIPDKLEAEVRVRLVREAVARLFELLGNVPDEVKAAVEKIEDPAQFADFIAATGNIPLEERKTLIAEVNVLRRLDILYTRLRHEIEILELSSKIHQNVRSELDKSQREYYLRRQMEAIRKELGETSSEEQEIAELAEKIAKAPLNEQARVEAERELNRLRSLSPASAEWPIIRNYLDWLLSLPWGIYTEDNLDLAQVRQKLDAHHYGLEEPKERILEFLAVRKLKGEQRGPILCLVGPPGVGKTSLGRSIAESMGRHFVRIALGGVRDEAEIRGHRRTYIGAMPGRIIQGMRRAGSMNPLMMLDEIDKLSIGYGDPAAALLEVLDPAQNSNFVDYYLNVPFDLSKVFFIATANVMDTIPGPLLDRMEIIRIPGYTEEEKLEIAKRYLLPHILDETGLQMYSITVDDAAIARVIRGYTREAGVRSLERELNRIFRRIAKDVAEGKQPPTHIQAEDIAHYLGKPRFIAEQTVRVSKPGVAIGLAWTPFGGEIMFIEATAMKGQGRLILTGKLGEVMKESAQAALSLVRSRVQEFGLPENTFAGEDLHIHVPEGATPKDGPSAGVALTLALISLGKNMPLSPDFAATGEITLRGTVLPVGGIREKVLAAARAGIHHVILPKQNEADLDDIPSSLRQNLTFHLVEDIGEVLKLPIFHV
jgi:ATP-dependent Lon protease